MFRNVPHPHYTPPPARKKRRRNLRPALFATALRKRHKLIFEHWHGEAPPRQLSPWEWDPKPENGPACGYFYNTVTGERVYADLNELDVEITDDMTVGRYLSICRRMVMGW